MKDCAPVKRDGGGGVPPPFPIKIDGGHRKRGTKSVPLLRCRSSLFCGAPLAGWKRWFSIVYITLRPPSTTTHPTLSLHRLYTIRYSMVTLGDRRAHAQTEYSVNPRTESTETYCVCRIPSVFSMQFKKKKKPCKWIEELGWWGGWRWCWGGGATNLVFTTSDYSVCLGTR